jgi:hypothetical protein
MGEKVVDSEAGPTERALVLGLEQRLWEFRLSNDAPQGSPSDRIVKGHRNGYRRAIPTLLHDSVAALLPDCGKSVLFEDPTDLRARKDPESTQPAPRPE